MIDSKRSLELREDIEALYFGYRAFTSIPDRILAERGLGRAHHRILYFVQREPGVSMGDLLTVLKVTKQAIHRPLKELESLGLITVTPDAHDKRMRRVAATEAGKQLEAQLTGEQMGLLESVFRTLDPEAERHWRTALLRLAQAGEGQFDLLASRERGSSSRERGSNP